MVIADRVAEVFSDARAMHDSALERLAAGDIRDAADKAWCATKRACDALILARTGKEPETTPETRRGMQRVATEDSRVNRLMPRYYTRMAHLHGECFYLGFCDPLDETERRIRETADLINEIKALAE